ncbi:Neuronal pentraxin-1-like 4, partial [Homarus americanus]
MRDALDPTTTTAFSLPSFTLCIWFNVVTLLELSSLLSYALSARDDDVINIYGVEVHYTGRKIRHSLPIRPLWWYPACLVVKPDAVAVWVAREEEIREASLTTPLALNGTLVLGQEQDVLDGGYISNQAFVGHLTRLTLWPHALTSDQLVEWSTCRTVEGSTLLDWDDVTWVVHNNTGSVSTHRRGPCVRNVPTQREFLLFTNQMTWSDARAFLEQTGLEMAAPRNTQERQQVAKLLARHQKQCTNAYSEGVYVWLGVLLNETIQSVVDVNSKTITDSPWIDRSKNMSGLVEVLPVSQDHNGVWHRENPFDELCFIGRYTRPPPVLRLQGLCRDKLNKLAQGLEFILTSTTPKDDLNTSVYLHGYHRFDVTQEGTDTLWCLRRRDEFITNQTNALACTSSNVPPTGRHNWQIQENFCHNTVNQSVSLALSTCTSYQFTCPNSSCIRLTELCDNVFDCSDGTDERNCFTCFTPPGYVDVMPPQIPVDITVHVEVTKIGNTDLLAFSLDLAATFTIRWRDSRLEFRHLQHNTDKALTNVVLNPEQKGKLNEGLYLVIIRRASSILVYVCLWQQVWTPWLWVMQGTLTPEQDGEHNLRVQRLGQGAVVSGEYITYKGSQNPLVLTVTAKVVVQCHFDLRMYPWDQQQCDAQV